MEQLAKYKGTWYEVASYKPPNIPDCYLSTAFYSIENCGLGVINRCFDCNMKQTSKIRGTATLLESCPQVKLFVDFGYGQPPMANYIILDTDFTTYSLVGSVNGYFWILSRSFTMSKCLFQHLLSKAREAGYRPSKLSVKTDRLV
jgi:lipocalin